MTAVVPRFVLTRSSGRGGLLQPDVFVVGDPFRPMTAIESILRLDRGSELKLGTPPTSGIR